LIACYYEQNDKEATINFLNENKLSNTPPLFVNILNLWLGNMKNYFFDRKKITFGKENFELSNRYLLDSLIHQQTIWVKTILEEDKLLKERHEPFYYAVQILDGNNDIREKIPAPMKEVVNDILVEIEEKREFYYG